EKMVLDGAQCGSDGDELSRRDASLERVRYEVDGRPQRGKPVPNAGEKRAVVAGAATAESTRPSAHAAEQARRRRGRGVGVGLRWSERIHGLERRTSRDPSRLTRDDRSGRPRQHEDETGNQRLREKMTGRGSRQIRAHCANATGMLAVAVVKFVEHEP